MAHSDTSMMHVDYANHSFNLSSFATQRGSFSRPAYDNENKIKAGHNCDVAEHECALARFLFDLCLQLLLDLKP